MTNQKKNQKCLYNPESSDFTCKWDGSEYTIKGNEIAYFDNHIADHIAHHLAIKILYGRETKVFDFDKEISEIKKDIIINTYDK